MIKVNGKKLEYITYPNGEWGVKNLYKSDIIPNNEKGIRNEIKWITDKNFAQEFIILISIKEEFDAEFILKVDYLPLSREDKTENGRINLFEGIFKILYDKFEVKIWDTMHNATWYETLSDWGRINLNKLNKQLIKICNKIERYSRVLFVFPDESAETRYYDDVVDIVQEFIDQKSKTEFVVAKKSRNKENGKINDEAVFSDEKAQKIKSFLPTHVIMVDDLISFGGSFLRVAKEIDKILGYHPETILSVYGNENQKLSDEFNKYIDEIVWEKDINFN